MEKIHTDSNDTVCSPLRNQINWVKGEPLKMHARLNVSLPFTLKKKSQIQQENPGTKCEILPSFIREFTDNEDPYRRFQRLQG